MELNYTKIKSFFSGLLTILVLVVVLLYPFNQAYWHYGWETEIPYSDFLIILAGIVWLVYFLFSGFKEKKIFLNRQTYYNSLPLLFLLVAAGPITT
jgi:cation transport ATPase